MKSILKLLVVAVIMAGCAACTKNDTGDSTKRACRPRQVIDSDNNLIAEFIYTDWGSPAVIKRQHTSTGEYEYRFYYDDQHNLTAFREGIFSETDTITNTYSKYVYEGDRIVSDSVFSGASLEDPVNEEYFVGKYVYDSIGRVIEYSTISSMDANYRDTARFSYPAENPFENNHSVLAGNKILMFVNRDYNLGNPGVTKYNENGYPTQFSEWLNGRLVYGYRFKSIVINNINYDCAY